jgi:hypothetical protein
LRWGRAGERQIIDRELGQLETEVGRWLDRLETGDYADRVEGARHLIRLEWFDYEIFLTSMLVGRPRARSSRMREAIERLLIGSADQVLAELKRRAANGTTATKEDGEAKRAADILAAAFDWARAQEFYELAYAGALWERNEIGKLLAQCRLHSRESIRDESEIYSACRGRNLVGRAWMRWICLYLGRSRSALPHGYVLRARRQRGRGDKRSRFSGLVET